MEKVDLEALDQLHAAATKGEWRVSITSNEDSCLGRYVFEVVEYPYKGNHEIFAANPYNRSEEELVADVELIAALHNDYPVMAAELRALRGKVKVLEAEAKQHDYDLLQTINERDEMEERVNAIAVALALSEAEQEWTSANDVGERCVEGAEALRERVKQLEVSDGN